VRGVGAAVLEDEAGEVGVILKRINVKDDREDYPDVDRIQRALLEHGYVCTNRQAVRLWERYSESMAAGWMRVPEDPNAIYGCVSPYFDEGEEL